MRAPGCSRRSFVLAAGALPFAVAAGPTIRNIGVLIGGMRRPPTEQQAAALVEAIRRDGVRDAEIDIHFGGGDIGQIRSQVEGMAKSGFDLYAVSTATAARELLRRVSGRPVVFWGVSDPVGNGFVGNAARPGGEVTGFALYPYEVGGKWLQLLRDVVPSVRHAHVVMSADNPNIVGWRRAMDADAARLQLKLTWPVIHSTADLDAALSAAARSAATGVIALADPFLSRTDHTQLIAAYATKVPVVTGLSAGAESGALVSYEVDQVDLARRAGSYVARIVHGAKPGDLPVQSADTYKLALNRVVARALGIELPRALLLQAETVVN